MLGILLRHLGNEPRDLAAHLHEGDQGRFRQGLHLFVPGGQRIDEGEHALDAGLHLGIGGLVGLGLRYALAQERKGGIDLPPLALRGNLLESLRNE